MAMLLIKLEVGSNVRSFSRTGNAVIFGKFKAFAAHD